MSKRQAHTTARAALALVLGGLVGNATAADLAECARIGDDIVRLFCYDRVAGRIPAAPVPGAEMDATGPSAAQAPSDAATPARASDSVQEAGPGPDPVATPKAPDAAAQKSDSRRIEARIVGEFEGWSAGTRFELDNGQVWEATGPSTHYSTSQSPAVVIRRDFLGQHLMSIDGVDSKALVRRVDDD